MPAKSKKQLRMIYGRRKLYGSKDKAPEKWKWVFDKEWGKLKSGAPEEASESKINLRGYNMKTFQEYLEVAKEDAGNDYKILGCPEEDTSVPKIAIGGFAAFKAGKTVNVVDASGGHGIPWYFVSSKKGIKKATAADLTSMSKQFPDMDADSAEWEHEDEEKVEQVANIEALLKELGYHELSSWEPEYRKTVWKGIKGELLEIIRKIADKETKPLVPPAKK